MEIVWIIWVVDMGHIIGPLDQASSSISDIVSFAAETSEAKAHGMVNRREVILFCYPTQLLRRQRHIKSPMKALTYAASLYSSLSGL